VADIAGSGEAIVPPVAVASGIGLAIVPVSLGAGDGDSVAWAIIWGWPEVDGAATAVSPRLATMSETKTPMLSRFKIASY